MVRRDERLKEYETHLVLSPTEAKEVAIKVLRDRIMSFTFERGHYCDDVNSAREHELEPHVRCGACLFEAAARAIEDELTDQRRQDVDGFLTLCQPDENSASELPREEE